MKAPKLDTRVTLQRPVQTDEGGGVTSSSWEDVASVWADLRPLKGSEYYFAQQTQSSVSHACVLRQPVQSEHAQDEAGETVRPTAAWRVKAGDRVFEVESVTDPDERGFWWKLRLVEGQKR